jgi:hypothetical protein
LTSPAKHVLVPFEATRTGRGTMNAMPPFSEPPLCGTDADDPPETQEERTARQVGMCRRLADLGMQLAEAAAAKALAAAEDEDPEVPRAKSRASGPDPAISFARYCTTVRQCITLEARLLAGPSQSKRSRKPPYDVRRNLLKRVFTEGTIRQHDAKEAASTLIEAGEEALAADPEGKKQIFDIVWESCKTTGIKIDKGTLHDEMLFLVEVWDVPIEEHPLLKPVPAWLIPHRPKGPGPPP